VPRRRRDNRRARINAIIEQNRERIRQLRSALAEWRARAEQITGLKLVGVHTNKRHA
jgi:hypothetical protein